MVIVLGIIARIVGFNIFRYIAYIRDDLLIVLRTSLSESALPQLMKKLERLGCSKPVVGLLVPTGYSFNLDGTNIYMTPATLFIAQALEWIWASASSWLILGVACDLLHPGSSLRLMTEKRLRGPKDLGDFSRLHGIGFARV